MISDRRNGSINVTGRIGGSYKLLFPSASKEEAERRGGAEKIAETTDKYGGEKWQTVNV